MKNKDLKHSFQLWDKSYMQGYPKDEIAVESPSGMGLNTTEKDWEIKLQKHFTDNAFLILANRERILSDSRLFLTPLPINNGLAYSGSFATPTLGVYVEWWMNCPYSVLFNEETDEMSLVWYISGSPLSGSNSCSIVNEKGLTTNESIYPFYELWTTFNKILKSYDEVKQVYQAYSLLEAIDILKNEITETYYAKSISEFRYNAKSVLLNTKISSLSERCQQMESERNNYERKWHFALFQLNRDEILSFHKEYLIKTEFMQQRIEELSIENRSRKEAMHHGELPNKEYQPQLMKNKKEVEQLKVDIDHFAQERISAIIPELKESISAISINELNCILTEIAEFCGTNDG